MAITLRKIASFFSPKPRKPQRARRGRSSTPEYLNSGLSSTTPSSRSSLGGSTTPRDPFVKGSSNVLTRLKSWIERTKSLPPAGFFNVDVGKQEKKIRYVVPLTYLSHEDLKKLLDDSMAEFGVSYVGALQLACEEDEFQEVLDTIEKSFEGDNREAEDEHESQRLIARKAEKLH